MDQAGNPVKFQVKFHATILFKAIAHAHQTLTLEYLCGSWAGLHNMVQVVRRWVRLAGSTSRWSGSLKVKSTQEMNQGCLGLESGDRSFVSSWAAMPSWPKAWGNWKGEV